MSTTILGAIKFWFQGVNNRPLETFESWIDHALGNDEDDPYEYVKLGFFCVEDEEAFE